MAICLKIKRNHPNAPTRPKPLEKPRIEVSEAHRNSLLKTILEEPAEPDHSKTDANDDPVSPLIQAAKEGKLETVSQLLAAKAQINEVDQDGRSALMEAAKHGQLDVVNHLVAAHANQGLKDKDGFTALELAVSYDHDEVIKVLGGKPALDNLAHYKRTIKASINARKHASKVTDQEPNTPDPGNTPPQPKTSPNPAVAPTQNGSSVNDTNKEESSFMLLYGACAGALCFIAYKLYEHYSTRTRQSEEASTTIAGE